MVPDTRNKIDRAIGDAAAPPDALPVHRQMLANMQPAERFVRAMSLSSFVRQWAWAGAERTAGADGPVAVRDRFLAQLYGADMTDDLRVLISRL